MKRNSFIIFILIAIISVSLSGETQQTACGQIAAMQKYEPKVPYTFEQLSPSCIGADGRWQKVLQVVTDGWITRMAKTDDPTFHSMIYAKKWDEVKIDAGALGIYAAGGIVRLGRLLPDSWLGKHYRNEWLPKVLDSQLPSGYIGTGYGEGCYNMDYDTMSTYKTPIPKYELLNTDLMFDLLLYEYEFSGDPKVLDVIVKLKDFVLENYLKPGAMPTKQLGTPHWVAIFRYLNRVYRYTGDEKIIEYLDAYYQTRRYNFKGWMTKKRMHHHLPDLCYTIQAPVTMYHFTGDNELLDLSLQGFENIENFALQTTGVPTGVEITLEKGCRKYTEHCGVVEWINACTRLLRSTGEVRFADVAERCMHNAYFGSKSPDGLCLTYYHTMNQLFATTWTGQYLRDYEPSSTFNGEYNMLHSPGCCNAITSKSFPQFLRNAVLRSRDGGFVIVFYGPMHAQFEHEKAGRVKLAQQTDYPYEDQIKIVVTEVEQQAAFPLHLRIPGWCRKAEIKLNGSPVENEIKAGTFLALNRTWERGDTIEIAFDFPITLDWDNSPAAGRGAAIVRGPVVFALPVSADWQYIGTGTPGDVNAIEAWNVLYDGKSIWNVALQLDLTNPENSLEKVKLDVPDNSQPWKYPPFGYKVKAKVIPHWELDRISSKPNTPAIPEKIEPSDETITVTLVPFGFTQLRMTVLPVLKAEAKQTVEHGQSKEDI